MFEAGKGFAPTEEGTPQGGVISPLLLNVALHGLEEAAGVRYKASGVHAGETVTGSPVAIRYADDVVVLCHSQEQAEQVKARLAEWLAPRGLAFNEDKTKIVHLDEGFDFLGFNVRRYHRKLLIKPSTGGRQAAPGTARRRDAQAARPQRGGGHHRAQPRHPGLGGLLPDGGVIGGVPLAGRLRVEARSTSGPRWRHQNKPRRWVVARYFGKFNKFRNDRWVFGDRDSGGYLVKFSWTGIERHVPVKGAASPDDPALASYWAERRKKVETPAGQVHPAPAHQAGRALPAMRGPPAVRRAATPVSPRMGTVVAARHPQGDSRQLPRPPRAARPAAR